MATGLRPRERVLAAVQHVQPDRPPANIHVTPEVGEALQEHFAPISYLEPLGVDLRFVAPHPLREPPAPDLGSEVDAYDLWGVGYRSVSHQSGGAYLEACELPLAALATLDDVEAYPWPSADDFDYSVIPEQIAAVGPYAVCAGHPGVCDIINGVSFGRGMAQVLTDIATEDEVGIAIIDRRLDFFHEHCRRILDAGQGRVDILYFGEDLGSQFAPTISPDMYDRFFRPRHQRFIALAHEHGARAMLHCCGAIRPFIPKFIEMGLDILDVLQPEAAGMEPEGLKRDFGEAITFSGMISVQETLPLGTVEECRAEARHRIDVIGKGGGYFLSPAHNIQAGTPLENILAVYEELTGRKLM